MGSAFQEALNKPWLVQPVAAGDGWVSCGLHERAPLSARFDDPEDLCRCPDGTLVVADYYNHCVRLVTRGAGAVTAALVPAARTVASAASSFRRLSSRSSIALAAAASCC